MLRRHVEDGKENITRFVVLAKNQELPPAQKDLTSILFSLKDKAGELSQVLNIFSHHKINLTSITSRPARLKPFEYYFYLDCEGHIKDKNIAQAMSAIEKRVFFFKRLGSYPKGK